MRIEVLVVADCPHRAIALERVHEALRHTDRSDVAVIEREVADVHEAGMRGSPTILFDGRDPFASDQTEPSLSCRLYLSADRVEGAPSVAALVEILASGTDDDRANDQ